MNDSTASGQICDYILTTKHALDFHSDETTKFPSTFGKFHREICRKFAEFPVLFLVVVLPHSSIKLLTCLALSQCVVFVCIDIIPPLFCT